MLYTIANRHYPESLVRDMIEYVSGEVYRYPNGRPWIISSYEIGRHERYFVQDSYRVYYSGSCPVTESEIDSIITSATSLGEASRRLFTTLSGIAWLAVSDDHATHVYSDILTKSSIFYGLDTLDGICSDDQLLMARLNSVTVNGHELTARMTDSSLSCINLRSIWAGVETINIGEYLVLEPESVVSPRQCWNPGAIDENSDSDPRCLSEAIRSSLLEKTQNQNVIMDLSGGLDSGTLAYFARDEGVTFSTLFLEPDASSSWDQYWSEFMANDLKVERICRPYSESLYSADEAENRSIEIHPEGPGAISTSVSAIPWLVRQTASVEPTVHINGNAGDILFGPLPSMYSAVIRRLGIRALPLVRRAAQLNGFNLRRLIAASLRHRDPEYEALTAVSSALQSNLTEEEHLCRWVYPPTIPEAFTSLAVNSLDQNYKEAAYYLSRKPPRDLLTTQLLHTIRLHAEDQRRMNLASKQVGGPIIESPFLDKRIIELALAAPLDERIRQVPPKSQLYHARPPTMPGQLFFRSDKGDYLEDETTARLGGIERQRSMIDEGLILDDLGLIDSRTMRNAIGRYSPAGTSEWSRGQVLHAEVWLRSLESCFGPLRIEWN